MAMKNSAEERWQEHKNPVAYPDAAIEVIDPRVRKYVVANAAVERLWTGARWAEGRYGSATGDICCLVISTTNACCDGRKKRAR
jgi:hypothetical protein